jgi:hypothetical protein
MTWQALSVRPYNHLLAGGVQGCGCGGGDFPCGVVCGRREGRGGGGGDVSTMEAEDTAAALAWGGEGPQRQYMQRSRFTAGDRARDAAALR